MKLLKFDVPKSKLDSLSEDVRIFFVQLGNVLNELNILQKCVIFSGAGIEKLNEVERSGQVSQALFFIKMLAGKLFEGKRLLENPFFGSHKDKLSPGGQESLKSMNRYFGKSNNIDLIRNKFAFHYDADLIKEELTKRPQDEILDIFLHPQMGNCLYSFSDVIANFAILNAINSKDHLQAMDLLVREVAIDVVGWFAKVAGECMGIIAQKAGLVSSGSIKIPDPPSIDEVKLPYFVRKR